MPKSRSQPIVLFLLRSYNDLDHIAPIVWKAANCGLNTAYLFVGKLFHSDYRIKYIQAAGSREVRSREIRFYFEKIRPKIRWIIVAKIADRLIGNLFGRTFLKQYDFNCIVTEWGGPDGKELAPYFLRPARNFNIPILAVPHGYHTWLNNDFNDVTTSSIKATGKLPQFHNRNYFSAYIVQSKNIKRYCIESGIRENRIHVLGSARFSKEWCDINYELCVPKETVEKNCVDTVVLFFLNHWDYNVNRSNCISLLERIAKDKDVNLIIKGHTRGRSDGGLSISEEKVLEKFGSLTYADDKTHSPELVHRADLVVVYGSSICFEALRQRKPVCWPKFVCHNDTIFDRAGVVTVANNEEDVINMIHSYKNGKIVMPSENELNKFFANHLGAEKDEDSVLQDYVDLIAMHTKKAEQRKVN